MAGVVVLCHATTLKPDLLLVSCRLLMVMLDKKRQRLRLLVAPAGAENQQQQSKKQRKRQMQMVQRKQMTARRGSDQVPLKALVGHVEWSTAMPISLHHFVKKGSFSLLLASFRHEGHAL